MKGCGWSGNEVWAEYGQEPSKIFTCHPAATVFFTFTCVIAAQDSSDTHVMNVSWEICTLTDTSKLRSRCN